MRTITFLNRAIQFTSLLFIFCILISCDQNKKTHLDNSKELAIKTDLVNTSGNLIRFSNSEEIQAKDTHILLTIDTKTINQNNINSKVIFSDDRSNPNENSGDPASFTSKVDKNMKVYWSGVAKDTTTGDEVAILGIFRKPDGGAEILESLSKDPNRKGVVVGKVKNKSISGFEYYSVEFRINQDTLRTYLVDPKLKMIE